MIAAKNPIEEEQLAEQIFSSCSAERRVSIAEITISVIEDPTTHVAWKPDDGSTVRTSNALW